VSNWEKKGTHCQLLKRLSHLELSSFSLCLRAFAEPFFGTYARDQGPVNLMISEARTRGRRSPHAVRSRDNRHGGGDVDDPGGVIGLCMQLGGRYRRGGIGEVERGDGVRLHHGLGVTLHRGGAKIDTRPRGRPLLGKVRLKRDRAKGEGHKPPGEVADSYSCKKGPGKKKRRERNLAAG
jgi:hypothetical protein